MVHQLASVTSRLDQFGSVSKVMREQKYPRLAFPLTDVERMLQAG